MKTKLNGYRGKLTSAQLAEGMNAAATNAVRLAQDAATLLDAGRFPTAASLAALSIEESGKVSILRSMALAKTSSELLSDWKTYRSHTDKNAAWILPQLFAKGASKLDDLRPLFDKSSDHPYLLDQIKQLGFYTDCLGRAHWSAPEAVIDEALARMLVKTAKVLVAGQRPYTKEEVDLWVEHLGPVWKRSPTEINEGLVKWYAAMQKSGLVPKGVNEMERFIYEGLHADEPKMPN